MRDIWKTNYHSRTILMKLITIKNIKENVITQKMKVSNVKISEY